MEINVRNYRRISTADIKIDEGVALIFGRNMQGKSSLIEAIRAGVSGDAMLGIPTADGKRATKARLNEVIRTGASQASVTISTGEGATQVLWPSGEVKVSKGGCPRSTIFGGSGISSYLDSAKSVRMDILNECLSPKVELDNLKAFLKETSPVLCPDDMVAAIWGAIVGKGWDNVIETAKEKGIKLKSAFRNVTGENWGANKGASWRPSAWDILWENVKLDDAEREKIAAKSAYDEAASSGIIDTTALEALIHSGEGVEEKLALVRETLKDLEAAIKKNNAACASYVALDATITVKCPCCGESLQVVRSTGKGGADNEITLQKAEKQASKKEIDAARLKRAELDGTGARLESQRSQIIGEIARLEKTAEDAAAAAKKLKEENSKAKGNADKAAELKAAFDAAEKKANMIRAVDEARRIHDVLEQNLAIQAALAPSGVRGKALASAIEKFNEILMTVAKAGGLGPVAVSPDDGSVAVGGMPYEVLSGSEALRVRCLLQIAQTKYDGSQIILIDIKDATDKRHVLGVVKMLQMTGLFAVVVAHANTKDDALDLGCKEAVAKGYKGKTFWIENGEVKPISEVVA